MSGYENDTIDEGSDSDYSVDADDQLQPEDSLDDRGVDDVLDEGYSPPDRAPKGAIHGLTAREMRDGETLDERLAEEVPDVGATDPLDDATADWRSHESDADDEFTADGEVGDRRAGRLVAPDLGDISDTEAEALATDCGIDGAGASAEEAAVHIIADDER